MQKRLLIVDNDFVLRESISSFLFSKGFYVYTSDSVQNALVKIKQNKPDLIITDIMMPVLDGYDLIKILHMDKKLCKIPVIFLTAKGMTNDRIIGYDLGCSAYLTKPFDPDELVSIINNLLKNISLLSLINDSDTQSISNIYGYPQNLYSIYSLTNKEKAIISLIAKGFMNKEIAMDLDLSVRNIEKYISRLLKKTNTRNRTELAQFFSYKIHKGE